MLTPGRHPEDPKMEQKADYHTPAQSKHIVSILNTFTSGICTCRISKLFWPKTSWIIILSVAESCQKTVNFFKQSEWKPFFFSPSLNHNSLSQRLTQINFKIAIFTSSKLPWAMNLLGIPSKSTTHTNKLPSRKIC